jgi:cation:H+ antiporter
MEVPAQLLSFDNWVMLGVSLLLVPFVFFRLDIGKLAGVGLAGGYIAYTLALVS